MLSRTQRCFILKYSSIFLTLCHLWSLARGWGNWLSVTQRETIFRISGRKTTASNTNRTERLQKISREALHATAREICQWIKNTFCSNKSRAKPNVLPSLRVLCWEESRWQPVPWAFPNHPHKLPQLSPSLFTIINHFLQGTKAAFFYAYLWRKKIIMCIQKFHQCQSTLAFSNAGWTRYATDFKTMI